VLGLTFLSEICAAPLPGRQVLFAVFGSPVVASVALFFCRFTDLAFFQPHESSAIVA